jgi:hypothetical protein
MSSQNIDGLKPGKEGSPKSSAELSPPVSRKGSYANPAIPRKLSAIQGSLKAIRRLSNLSKPTKTPSDLLSSSLNNEMVTISSLEKPPRFVRNYTGQERNSTKHFKNAREVFNCNLDA